MWNIFGKIKIWFKIKFETIASIEKYVSLIVYQKQ